MQLSDQKKIMVVGDSPRATLAIIRSLGRAGFFVVVGIESKDSIIAYSRYAGEIVYLPSLRDSRVLWQNAVKQHAEKNAVDLIIPATDAAFFALSECADTIKTRIALPDKKAFDIVTNKKTTLDCARELNIPVPAVLYIENKGDQFVAPEKYPVVITPVVSKRWRGEYQMDFAVRVVKNKKEFDSALDELLPFTSVLVEEYVSGVGVGQEFLCKGGKVLAAFQHERIHESEGSGGSSFRKSTQVDSKLLAYSEALIKRLNWTGVLMIEYRVNKEKNIRTLLEINGRFWGSLPLAIAAGADFPAWLCGLELWGEEPRDTEYKKELYARNNINDFRWFLVRVRTLTVIKKINSFVGYVFGIARNIILGREVWDSFAWDDMGPFWKECGTTARIIIQKTFSGKNIFPSFQKRARVQERLMKLFAGEPHIVFVCKGNINRSPFAEGLARNMLPFIGGRKVTYSSRSLLARDGRAATPYIIEVAKKYGVSLEGHRSKVLTEQDVRAATIIFCMDMLEFREIIRRFPDVEPKLFLLGALQENAGTISDPWGREYGDYMKVCERIQKSIRELVRLAV